MHTEWARQVRHGMIFLFAMVLIGAVATAPSLAQEKTTESTPAKASNAIANTEEPAVGGAAGSTEDKAIAPSDPKAEAEKRATRERLQKVQVIIDAKTDERKAVGDQLESAGPEETVDLQAEVDQLTQEIDKLRDTFERLATGGADSTLFINSGEVVESDWKQDIALIAKPVLDSLKELTEKPRRISELNEAIAQHRRERSTAGDALEALRNSAAAIEPENETLARSIKTLNGNWQKRFNNAQNEIDVARLQISSLQGDASLFDSLTGTLMDFIKGRGLTLLIATGAAGFVYLLIRFMMSGYRRKLLDKTEPSSRTHYRMAEYSVRAFTFLVCLVVVFIVFYERGDVLLLGLLILLMVGLALSVRHLLPRYVAEARLLLNVGGLREAERVVYHGLPWRVEAVNMFTILRNPELTGILRIPLSELHVATSRPIVGKETWFPTSRGDMVMIEGSMFAEVLSQSPDTVELKTGGGQRRAVPSAEFYAMSMVNLSRGEVFGAWTVFGLDYDQQADALDEVPRKLRNTLRDDLDNSDVAEFVKDILVELKAAGSSSLDYLLFVTFDTRAAKSYLRIERILQRACVRTCNEEGWNIPFPHLSVVQKGVAAGSVETERETEGGCGMACDASAHVPY